MINNNAFSSTTVLEFFFSFPIFQISMNAEKTLTIVSWMLLVKIQMDPLCAPVYLDLTEMDGSAEVKALREDVNILRTNLKYFGKSPKIRFLSYCMFFSPICPNNCSVVFFVKIYFSFWEIIFFRSTAQICKFLPWILPELCDLM